MPNADVRISREKLATCVRPGITVRLLKDAKPGDILRDELVRGLHVRVGETRAAFYLHFRTRDGIERRPKVGTWPSMTISQARNVARDILASVATGADPFAESQEARRAPSVADLCEKYLQHVQTDPRAAKKTRSVREDRRLIEKHVLPRLGARKVRGIEHADIETLHGAMAASPIQANRIVALLSRLFNLAEKWKLRDGGTNPCRHIDKYPERKRRRYLRADEAPRVAAALRAREGRQPQAVVFVYLLLLTGARPDEIARARWDWLERVKVEIAPQVFEEAGVLRLPDSKTGERSVYLSAHIMRLLEGVPRTSETLTGIKSPKKLWDRVRVEAGCPDLRLYDLRHSFASVALAAGYSLPQIGELLGHSSTQTTSRYTHLIEATAHAAAADTSARLEIMLNGNLGEVTVAA